MNGLKRAGIRIVHTGTIISGDRGKTGDLRITGQVSLLKKHGNMMKKAVSITCIFLQKASLGGMLALAGGEPDRFTIVDASVNEVQVKHSVYETLAQKFGLKQPIQDTD